MKWLERTKRRLTVMRVALSLYKIIEVDVEDKLEIVLHIPGSDYGVYNRFRLD